MNNLKAGDKVKTVTGDIATIIDPRDGHIILAYIAGRGQVHLHETKILGLVK
jgi:preprotein translocase subunit YajC